MKINNQEVEVSEVFSVLKSNPRRPRSRYLESGKFEVKKYLFKDPYPQYYNLTRKIKKLHVEDCLVRLCDGKIFLQDITLFKESSEGQAFEMQLCAWEETENGMGQSAAGKIRKCFYRSDTNLDLSDLKLQTLPPVFSYLKGLKKLKLGDNCLTEIPRDICEMKNLEVLDASNNNISALPAHIGKLKSLNTLILRKNRLSFLPVGLQALLKIKKVDLAENFFELFPQEVLSCINLKILDLSSNQIVEIPEQIKKLKKLIRLFFSKNRLEMLPNGLNFLKKLEELVLEDNLFREFPKEIVSLSQLSYLYLSKNKIISVPDSVVNLKNLKVLCLSENRIERLPEAIFRFSSLDHFDVSKNNLSNLPEDCSVCNSLKRINLSNNKFETVSPIIFSFRELRNLDLSGNLISTLPEEIQRLRMLFVLNLSQNQIESLPDVMCTLEQLFDLDVSNNKLSSLPPDFSRLMGLECLNLEGNNFIQVPQEILSIRSMKNLFLANNQLTHLPTEIGTLFQLTNISVHSNGNLEALPFSLGGCTDLTPFSIEGTLIEEAQIDMILERARSRCHEDNSEALPGLIDSWQRYSGFKEDLTFVRELSNREKSTLYEWIRRLEKSKDFGSNQKALTLIVCQMLYDLSEDKIFRDVFLSHVFNNNSNCEDRAAMSLNILYTFWKTEKGNLGSGAREKVLFAYKIAKTNALREALKNQIDEQEKKFSFVEAERVEIELYYENLYKEELGLETATSTMHYAICGQRDWIQHERLKKETIKNAFQFLLEMDPVRSLSRKDPEVQKGTQAVQAKYQDSLERMDNETEQAHEIRMISIQVEIKEEENRLIENYLKKMLEK